MSSEHPTAYELKHSAILAELKECMRLFEHVEHLTIRNVRENLFWLVVIIEACGLRDLDCTDDCTVSGTLPNGATMAICFESPRSAELPVPSLLSPTQSGDRQARGSAPTTPAATGHSPATSEK
jgi:hypothetical protein